MKILMEAIWGSVTFVAKQQHDPLNAQFGMLTIVVAIPKRILQGKNCLFRPLRYKA